jgi:DNA-directed RNA polymerase subunit RPC12/RpoP
MEDIPSSAPWPIFYECPACHQEVEAVAGQTAQLIPCPHCGEPFLVAAEDGSTDLPDEEKEAAEKSREDEINSLKIRQLSRGRRAAIRTQGYCIVTAGGCAVGAIQLLINAVKRFHAHGNPIPAIAYLILAAGLLRLGYYFLRLSIKYNAEAKKHSLPDPPTPPDFSTLSDGSQQIRHLEDMR